MPDSTAVRVFVLGTGAVVTIRHLRRDKERGSRPPARFERDG